ncbi:MAG: DUF1688 family protein [Bdellovibrionota bacterium]
MDLTSKPEPTAPSNDEIEYILSPEAIRDRALDIYNLTQKGDGLFEIKDEKLEEVADYVLQVIRDRHPDLKISYHSRWSHFNVGGRNRVNEVREEAQRTPGMNDLEWARMQFDLVVTSVLLDAGTGPSWRFKDIDGHIFARSEGLAVASLNMFTAGAFSSDKTRPLQADSRALTHITEEKIKESFQVSVSNPLSGTKGRAELLHKLGKVVENTPDYFLKADTTFPFKRIGNLVDYFVKHRPNKKIEAVFILKTVLKALGGIWPGRIVMNDVNLGDTWYHDKLGTGVKSFVPLHKLSQWLTYSLLEPLEEFGFEILDLNQLTGLAEYRNGGLFLDLGLFAPKDPNAFSKPVHADSRLVIEWRSLTVYFLDEVAKIVRQKLGKSEQEFPLAKVLEGGTWWAGRKIAQAKRPGGGPPLDLISDGTVF